MPGPEFMPTSSSESKVTKATRDGEEGVEIEVKPENVLNNPPYRGPEPVLMHEIKPTGDEVMIEVKPVKDSDKAA